MRNVTLLAAVCGLLALAPRADAQGCDATDPEQAGFTAVDIRDINAVSQANIDQLNAAVADGSITIAQMQALLTNDLEGSVVEFDAVVLSDPILSAIRSSVGGIPGGIHFYVRDMSAADGDPAGRGVQVVDNRGGGEAQALRVGSVITVCARVAPFDGSGGKAMQVGGNNGIFSITQTDILDPTDAANAALFAPVVVTTDDIHDTLPGGETILDFDNYADFNGQYVRFEGITVVQGVQGDRPNVLLQSPTQDTQVNIYDTSACFRNDRDASYFPPDRAPACIDEDFVPPSTGTANLQGFLIFQGDDGGFNYSEPGSANFVVNPFEESDFEITAAPPTIAVNGPDSVPGPDDNVTITATIVPAQGTIASAEIAFRYINSDGDETQTGTAAMSNTSGDEWSGEIPARANDDANGSFVAYEITATDSGSLTSTSEESSYRIFEGAINSVALVQRTFDGGSGDSPLLTGEPATFDLTATVMSVIQDGSVFRATIQDAADEFGGVWMFLGSTDQGLSVGDQINITQATINENFGLTQLEDLTFTTLGTVTPFDPVLFTTGQVAASDPESAEGVLIRFENVTITSTNADAPSGPFGEFAVSSTGSSAQAVRVDDLADGDDGINFPDNDPGAVYSVGDVLSYIQGPLYYSFSNFKLAPRTPSDIGDVVVALEDEPGLGAARIERVFPNPSAGTARVQFALDVAGQASVWLYDVTGRQVATLAAGAMAAGPHSVDLDVSGLAAGVYVLRLEAEGGVDTARISVVR